MPLTRTLLGAVFAAFALGAAALAGHWFSAAPVTCGASDFTCSMHPKVHNAAPGLCPMCHMELVPAQSGAVIAADGVTTIDPVLVQNAGVRTARVVRGPIVEELSLCGTVQVAQDRERDITLKFGGFVDTLYANRDGMAIRAGDPLFDVYSPDLIVAEERLIVAKRSSDPANLQNARVKLERWDLPASAIEGLLTTGVVPRTIRWPSPVSGLLVSRSVVQGARLDPMVSAMRIADLSVVWVEAQVPESQIYGIQIGMEVSVELAADPGVVHHGKVALVVPKIDERTRTGALRIELPNPEARLLPGMFARVRTRVVHANEALVVCDDAILETGLRSIAWVALGDGRFAPRVLRLGRSGDGGVTEVLGGLALGEQVVTSGQLLIDADSRMREGSRRFGDDDLLPPGPLAAAMLPVLPAGEQDSIDAVFRAYMDLANALASDRDDESAWQALHEAAKAKALDVEGGCGGAARGLCHALEQPARGLASRREAFLAISDSVIAMCESARPSDALGTELVVVHCSMKPGSWLQVDRDVRNPYYGSEMLACGAVQRVLPTAAKALR